MSEKPLVAILMGSKSDLEMLEGSLSTLKDFDVPFTARILSAHRTPHEVSEFVEKSEQEGIQVFICAAGMSAHLAGVVAAHTTLPVIAVPIPCEPFNGFDSLLSMVQMPPGIPVATISAGKAGAKNSALLAISILALKDETLAKKLKDFRKKQAAKVLEADKELQKKLYE